MTKTHYHHGDLKNASIEIAFDFIAKEDFEKLTLKVLSDAMGTSRSAIYKHFKSKDALIETLIEKGFEKFDRAFSSILADTSTPLIDRFYQSAKMYINFVQENPNLYRLLFGKKYAHLREEIISIKDDNCSGFGALKKAIQEGQDAGLLKEESAYERTIMIWAMLHGFSTLIIDGFMDVEALADKLFESMFQDLLSVTLSNKVKLVTQLPFTKHLIEPKK